MNFSVACSHFLKKVDLNPVLSENSKQVAAAIKMLRKSLVLFHGRCYLLAMKVRGMAIQYGACQCI